jgi:DNA-binding Xre family transcriptional regulator
MINESDLKTANNLKIALAKHLKTKNISKEQFLKVLGWTEGNFNCYLNAEVRIGDKALEIICNCLECNPENIRHF